MSSLIEQACRKMDAMVPGEFKEATVEKDVQKFASGAVRSVDGEDTRYDLISPVGLRRLAERYALGFQKYGANNWEKGIPASNLVNHAMRHIERWRAGDTSEDNLAGAVWNLVALMHFEELLPGMIDVPSRKPVPAYDDGTGGRLLDGLAGGKLPDQTGRI